jgi:hypothetical protein
VPSIASGPSGTSERPGREVEAAAELEVVGQQCVDSKRRPLYSFVAIQKPGLILRSTAYQGAKKVSAYLPPNRYAGVALSHGLGAWLHGLSIWRSLGATIA